jgi:ribokinase
MPDVITLGDINIDLIAPIPAYPPRGGDSIAEGALLHTGGSAVNTAVALACLGLDVGFIGRVGQDALAAQAMADLEDANVDTRMVQLDPSVSTGIIFIAVTPDGERTMFGARGANSYTDPALLTKDYFRGARWFHFSGYALLAEPQRSAVLRALDLAAEAGCGISLDVAVEPALHARHEIYRLLPRIDVLFPNETELSLLTRSGDSTYGLDILLERGVGAVVAKFGANGSRVATREFRADLPAFSILAVDTTGAGDNFDAGFIAGRLAGLSWQASAILGNAVGALAACYQGAGVGSVTRGAVHDLVKKHVEPAAWSSWGDALDEVLTYLKD